MTSNNSFSGTSNEKASAPTHQHAQRVARGASAGAVPSNTAPANCISSSLLVLRKGIDSLYLSVPGQITAESEARLGALKRAAQSRDPLDQGAAQIALLGHQFAVMGGGNRHFQYVLRCPAYRIQISGSSAKTLPLIYGQISSDYLASKGVKAAAAEFKYIAESLGIVEDVPRVSRADIYVDFVYPCALEDLEQYAFVTRAMKLDRHIVGTDMTGYSIGLGGELSARLYNKTIELEKSKKYYLKSLWHQAGWEPPQPVYRLEFQFEQTQLKAHGCTTVPNLMRKLGPVWAYATQDWLRLCIPNPKDKTKSRWPLYPMWEALSLIEWSGPPAQPSRPVRTSNAPSDDSMFNRLFSVITGYMAAHNITDPGEALDALYAGLRAAKASLGAWSGLSFEDLAYDKAAFKACKFNLPFHNSSDRSKLIQDEAVARAHRKLSK